MIDLGRVSEETKSEVEAPAFEQPINGLKYEP
jgi:hypothetical protein